MAYGTFQKTVVLDELWTTTFAEAVCQNVSIVYSVYSVYSV